MMNARTIAYFDDLVARVQLADIVRREPWAQAHPNRCHANCDAFVRQHSDFEVVRGWLVQGGHFFMPHSVVRQRDGALVDITPDPSDSRLPFVAHLGTEAEYAILRQGRDGGWLRSAPTESLSIPAHPSDGL